MGGWTCSVKAQVWILFLFQCLSVTLSLFVDFLWITFLIYERKRVNPNLTRRLIRN